MRKALFAAIVFLGMLGVPPASGQAPALLTELHYKFKATIYIPSWNSSLKKFGEKEQVFYFNSWNWRTSEWTDNCLNKGLNVRLEDGVKIGAGEQRINFTSQTFLQSTAACFDERRMSITELSTGKVVWRSSNW